MAVNNNNQLSVEGLGFGLDLSTLLGLDDYSSLFGNVTPQYDPKTGALTLPSLQDYIGSQQGQGLTEQQRQTLLNEGLLTGKQLGKLPGLGANERNNAFAEVAQRNRRLNQFKRSLSPSLSAIDKPNPNIGPTLIGGN